MAVTRTFLGWKRPGLLSAAEYLAKQFGTAESLDLSQVIVAVPGSRAGRRLLELLVQGAEARGVVLHPPQIVTSGQLPELLYEAKRPFADDLVQQLAWVGALRSMSAQELAPVLPSLPPAEDLGSWLSLAQMFARLHGELAADGLDCQSVLDCGAGIEGFDEAQRWQALVRLQRQYLEMLDRLELWDLQTARLFAIRHGECHTDRQIVLVATADLNQTQRLMLDQVAERVTALVVAPETMADRFDGYGCLVPEAWQDVVLPLPDDRIDMAEDPAGQATTALRAIGRLGARYSAEQITLGVPDPTVVPHLQQQLRQEGIRTRYGAGEPLSRSLPLRLLAAVAEYLAGRRYRAFAALVRHPALDDWLASQGLPPDWLAQLDAYYAEHLPHTVGAAWPGLAKDYEALQQAAGAIDRLLGNLSSNGRLPLGHWGPSVLGLLAEVFGRADLDLDDPAQRALVAACGAVQDAVGRLAAVPDPLMPEVTGAEAVRILLEQAGQQTVPPPSDRGAVEMLGWLELPLDDAPAMIVTGLNEGIVPTSVNADLFLPNRLRCALGIEDNQRRYARDAYALAVITGVRSEWHLICGRRAPGGEPLIPSRLLLACDDAAMVRRTKRFFSADEGRVGTGRLGRLRPGMVTILVPPPPMPLPEPVTSMRVTEFRDFLACPYRYYLRHRLGLVAVDDTAEELDGARFGSLAHEVLFRFGTSPVAHARDARTIEAWLCDKLDEVAARQFGPSPRPAILVQLEHLRLRLRKLASWQADWASQGWEIRFVEYRPDHASLLVDGSPMGLRGRIARIDVNTQTGQWAILDYKTFDIPLDPDETHRRGDQWVDLQLPLYRHLAAGLGLDGPPVLGYIALPKDVSRTGAMLASWDQALLDEADQTACDVVRRVRAQEFGKPVMPPPAFFDEFAAICQDNQFREPHFDAANGGAEGQP